jgi:predicted DNA-binding transcriptional regulator AlpA
MLDVQVSPVSSRLIDAKEVGRLLGCSWRSVYRHADSGRIPKGVKLVGLRKWDLRQVVEFIQGGCIPPKQFGKGGRT